MSKLTGIHSIFRKNSIYGANIGFHALTFARTLGMFTTYDDRSGCYRGALDQSSVHGKDVEACCPVFLCENQ